MKGYVLRVGMFFCVGLVLAKADMIMGGALDPPGKKYDVLVTNTTKMTFYDFTVIFANCNNCVTNPFSQDQTGAGSMSGFIPGPMDLFVTWTKTDKGFAPNATLDLDFTVKNGNKPTIKEWIWSFKDGTTTKPDAAPAPKLTPEPSEFIPLLSAVLLLVSAKGHNRCRHTTNRKPGAS